MKRFSRDFAIPRVSAFARLACMGVFALLITLFIGSGAAWAEDTGTITESDGTTAVQPESDGTYNLTAGGAYTMSGTFDSDIAIVGGSGTAAEIKLSDTTVSGGLTINSGNVTLDLQGSTLTGGDIASVITVKSGANVTITNGGSNRAGTITGGASASASVITVESGGALEISAGEGATTGSLTINGNGAASVITVNGSLTMNDGKENATVTITNGGGTALYEGSPDTNGGGVYVSGVSASFIMNGGTISGNSATYGGGVNVSGASASFTMNGGTISSNTATHGGGVYVGTSNGGTFTMNSGSIQSNKAINGGGVYLAIGTFTMGVASDTTTTPTISSNIATGSGGGVHVSNDTFNMNSGTIGGENTGNAAASGGGIYASAGSVNIGSGASTTYITHNTATLYGGGVYLYGASLTLDGTVYITENTIAGANSNLYLGHTIVEEIDGRVQFASTDGGTSTFDTTNSSIGVTQASAGVGFTYGASATFTSGDMLTSYSFFVSDLSNYTLSTIEDTYNPGSGDTTYTEYTLILAGSVASLFGGGEGTEAAPYLISTLAHLNNLSANVGNAEVNGKYFKQTANITITGTYAPIGGSNSTAFTGTYDGGGYTISGSISNASTTNQGIFGQIGAGGTVKNLTAAVSVTGLEYVGGIAGVNHGTITSCYNKGTITGSASYTGGIAGANYGTIQYCYNAGTICGGACTGGIAGVSSGAALNGSGFIYIGDILHCYNLGTVSATGDNVGGIVGNAEASTTTQYCYNIGACSGVLQSNGSLSVGSIAGYVSTSANVQYCYYLSGTLNSTTLIGSTNGLDADGEREPNDYGEGAISNNTALTLAQMTADAAKTNMPYLFDEKKPDGSTIWFTHYNGTPGFVLVTEPVPESAPAAVVTSWYVVTLSTSGGGVVAPELSGFETIKMKEGSSYTFGITPNSGYVVSAVYVDGTNIGAVASYTIESINSDRSIRVDFVSTGAGAADDVADDAEDVADEADSADDLDADASTDDPDGGAEDSATAGTDGTADGVGGNPDDTAGEADNAGTDAEAGEAKGGVVYIVMGVLVAIAALGGVGFWLFKRKTGLGED